MTLKIKQYDRDIQRLWSARHDLHQSE
jgi:hypothetical protein